MPRGAASSSRRDSHLKKPGVAERPAQLPRPRRHRLRLVQPAVLRAGRLLRPRRPVHREAGRDERPGRRSTRRWITRFHVDGFRVDTAQARRTRRSSGCGCRGSARRRARPGIADFPIFGEVTLNDAIDLSAYVRDRGLPQRARLPVPGRRRPATPPARPARRALGDRLRGRRLLPHCRTASTRRPPTFLGNHDMGRGAQQILSQAPSLAGDALLKHVAARLRPPLPAARRAGRLLRRRGRDDRLAAATRRRGEDMFPTQVTDWQTEQRVGSPPIGTGSSFDVTDNPIEEQLKQLAAAPRRATRRSRPARRSCAARGDAVLVVSRIDLATGTRGRDGVQQRRHGRAR